MKNSESSCKVNSVTFSKLLALALLLLSSTRATASLLGYWRFEEGTGTTAADSSGNGFNGTLAGSPIPVWTSGYVPSSGALDFTPTARVSLANDPAFQLTGPLTLTAWTLADVTAGGRVITKGGNSGSRGWSLGVENTGYYSFQIPSSSTSLTTLNTAPGSVALGVWTHLAAVYDPTALTMKLYINGALASATLTGVVPAVMYNPASIAPSIGTRSDGTTRWDGKLDEIRIYNEALSQAQILALSEVPEPTTTAFVICGGLVTVLVRRRALRREC